MKGSGSGDLGFRASEVYNIMCFRRLGDWSCFRGAEYGSCLDYDVRAVEIHTLHTTGTCGSLACKISGAAAPLPLTPPTWGLSDAKR